jgi:hypothetical protein
VNLEVASSTQNQPPNALLFLCPEVLGIDIGEDIKAVRDKRPDRPPIVISKEEAREVLGARSMAFTSF